MFYNSEGGVHVEKYKLALIILSSLLVMSLFFSVYLLTTRYSANELQEREEILVATLWKLEEENSIPKDKIENIRALKAKAGFYPKYYKVAINLKDGKQILYTWTDENKTEVIRD